MKKGLIPLVGGVAGVAVTVTHLQEGAVHFHFPDEMSWESALLLSGSLVSMAVGLSHLEHSLKMLFQRSVACAALVIVLVCSVGPLIVGTVGMFAVVFLHFTPPEEYALWGLGMLWGGAIGTFGGIWILAAIEERAVPQKVFSKIPRAANDNADPKAPVKVTPAVVKAAVRVQYEPRDLPSIYSRPIPRGMLRYVA